MLKLEPGQYWIFEADTSIDIWEFQKSHNDTSANKHKHFTVEKSTRQCFLGDRQCNGEFLNYLIYIFGISVLQFLATYWRTYTSIPLSAVISTDILFVLVACLSLINLIYTAHITNVPQSFTVCTTGDTLYLKTLKVT